jgi:serine/threonine protein kinase
MYPQFFGKYVLERELAIGGMARVVLATLRGAGGFEKKLVVKQIRDELAIDEEFVDRFVQEAKTTVALSHPNIVPVYELGVEQGTYFLAMEFVDGVSVDALLKTDKGDKRGLSPEEGAYLGVEICRALDYAHRMQVIHRDITPRNVMVDEEGQVKIIDFGIASRASVAGQDVFGTPGHMPPEQMERKELGPPTDLFAVAALLMETWSGAAPFRRKTPTDSLAAMRAPHPKPSDFDARLAPVDAVLASAMALDPAKRPQRADELGRVLRKFLQDVDVADVAKKLGDRVRDARALAAKKKRAPGDPSLFKPSRPTMDLRPKTFAAREEIEQWAPPTGQGEGGGTRRLPASVPPASEIAPKSEPKDARIETVATKPIETPVEPSAQSTRTARRATWAAVAFTGLAAAGAIAFVAKGSTGPTTQPATTSTTAPTSVPPPTTSPTPPPLPSPTPSPPPSATASVTARVPNAQINLLGDPGTQVSVDGAGYRPCPAVLYLKPGRHSVRFFFPDTKEERGESLTLSASDRVTMRADFLSSTPTIRVER